MPEGVRALAGYSTLMQCASAASGVIPQIAVIPGTCAGSAAVVAGMFDFIIIPKPKELSALTLRSCLEAMKQENLHLFPKAAWQHLPEQAMATA